MASSPQLVAFLADQLSDAGPVTAKKLFGEYALYLDDKLVALVCDDRLLVKPTTGGRAFAPECTEAPPYPGAKPSLLIDPERWDDRAWLAQLIRVTYEELPKPKPRKRKTASSK